MLWKKLGVAFCPTGQMPWAQTHAMIPTPFELNDSTIRVFVTCCDSEGIGRPGYVDVSKKNPLEVKSVSSRPLLDVGSPGCFDENGVLACSVIDVGKGKLYMYYAGFELGQKIRYRLLTGLAVSNDGGESFERVSEVPILERSASELFFRGGPYCTLNAGLFRMWYVAGSRWINLHGKPMPSYDIRYIESNDGIHWPKNGSIHIPLSEGDEHGFGRPCVIGKPDGGYRMFFSVRRVSLGAYRLGYAESVDGVTWIRKDAKLNLDVGSAGFDSAAIMYAAPIQVGSILYLFYNGNDFGRDGFAIARLEEE